MRKLLVSLSILFAVIVFFPLRADTAETAIQTDIAVIKTDIKNLNEKVDSTFKTLDAKIDDKFNALEQRFDSLEKNFDRQNTLIIACIAIPMALITLMIAWRSLIKDASLQKQIDTLSEIIESQKQQLTEKSPQS